MEAERVKCQFLHLGRVDAALYLSDFNLCHQFRLFAVKHFFNSHAAVLGHLGRRTKLAEGGDCGLNKVVGVGRTFRLCKHVGNANTLQNCTHGTTGLYSRTFRCGLEEDARTAKLGCHLVGNRALVNRNLDKILLCGLYALRDGGRNLVGFAKGPAGTAGAGAASPSLTAHPRMRTWTRTAACTKRA